MLRYLVDPANAITAAGILLSAFALHFALAGNTGLAIALALWAMLADHLDGVVAGRTKNRPPEMAKMGKSLDGFADIIYGSILPVVCIVQLSHASALSLLTGTVLLFTGAVRLSYFNNFGLSADGRFTGVPLSYDVPLLALLYLARTWLDQGFIPTVNGLFLVLAVLHVAPIRVPSPKLPMYVAIITFSLVASALLVLEASR